MKNKASVPGNKTLDLRLARIAVSLLVWSNYALACVLPAVAIRPGQTISGWEALRGGFVVLPIWLANVWLVIAWLCFICRRDLSAIGWAAFGTTSGGLLWLAEPECADAGYWCWVASPALLMVCSCATSALRTCSHVREWNS